MLTKKVPVKNFCPKCETEVTLKEQGDRLVMLNMDGTPHNCEPDKPTFEKHPIGQAVIGKVVTNFELKGRVLTLTLEDGNMLRVSAAGKPLSIELGGPRGIIQE